MSPQDIFETVREAIEQPGRYTNVCLTGGSIPGPDALFKEEVQIYIETLQAIGANFSTRRFPSQLISSAFPEDQLARIYENTGLTSWTTDSEVLDEEKFNWICPGKAARVGFKESASPADRGSWDLRPRKRAHGHRRRSGNGQAVRLRRGRRGACRHA